MSPLTWHDLYYPSRMEQTPKMLCKHYRPGLNHGTCCCSLFSLILEVSAFMSLQFTLISLVCTCGWVCLRRVCVEADEGGALMCVYVCLSLQVMIWSQVCVCVLLRIAFEESCPPSSNLSISQRPCSSRWRVPPLCSRWSQDSFSVLWKQACHIGMWPIC